MTNVMQWAIVDTPDGPTGGKMEALRIVDWVMPEPSRA